MRTPLARLNLGHHKTRTLIAVAGVAFAITLIFMQFGFHGSLEQTATRIYDKLDFDVLLASADYQNLARPGSFSADRLFQAGSVTGVQSAVPLYVGVNAWRNPQPEAPLDAVGRALGWGHRRRKIQIIGFRLEDPVFQKLPELDQAEALLRPVGHVLIDRRSRAEFGRPERDVETDLGWRNVRVAGHFTLGTGFGADGLLLVSDETFAHIFGGRALTRVSLGLLRAAPGADPEQVAAQLNRSLPSDVRARSRRRLLALEAEYWLERTSVGTIFRLGLFVIVVVGVVFVYQVMSNDIASRLHEFATMKAMGYGDSFLARVVIAQALLLAALAYVPACLVALVLDELTRLKAGIPIEMTWSRAGLVLFLSTVMCTFSALLALRKVRTADPAELF